MSTRQRSQYEDIAVRVRRLEKGFWVHTGLLTAILAGIYKVDPESTVGEGVGHAARLVTGLFV